MENRRLVVGNLKMYMSYPEVLTYIAQLTGKLDPSKLILFPSSLYVSDFQKAGYSVGIQNFNAMAFGAHTGEINAQQIASMNVGYVLVGHSERRLEFEETDHEINAKIVSALRENLTVILCVGESLTQYEGKDTFIHLQNQLTQDLKNLTASELKRVIIAYEPIWAIGTGKIPRNDEIEQVVRKIKQIVFALTNYEEIPVLYGGSVNASNIETLQEISNLQGYLIGKAATKPEEVLKIVEVVCS